MDPLVGEAELIAQAEHFALIYRKEKGFEDEKDQEKRYWMMKAFVDGFVAGFRFLERNGKALDEIPRADI